ncbi:hypothetical protein D3C77_287390 [compost metagenome]
MVLKVVPGDPISELFEPLKNSRAPASLNLVRLTSTKRMSACTWLGKVGSWDGGSAVSAMSAVAAPLTNSMAWRGVLEQAVQSIRLVAPGLSAVNTMAWSPLACTSAIFASPTATRVMLTGARNSCCKPWSISMTPGNCASAAQPLLAAWAMDTVVPVHRATHSNCLITRTERLLI